MSLQNLRRRFEKDARYKEERVACVNSILEQGYAETVSADELEKSDGKVWNPADDASRGTKAEKFLKCRRWINGPEFLHRSEEEWPKLDVDHQENCADDSEVKKMDPTVNIIVKELQNATNYDS